MTKPATYALLLGWALLLVVAGFVATLRLAGSREAVVILPDAAPTSTIPSPPLVPLIPLVTQPLAVASAAVALPTDLGAAPGATTTETAPLQTSAPLHEGATGRGVASARPLRPDQQDRLNALQRLCDQRTVTAAECAAKRRAILREN